MIIALAISLCLSLAGNIILALSKKSGSKSEEVVITPVPIEFGKEDLQIEPFHCRIIVLKQFVSHMDSEQLQEYAINRLCSENLADFFLKNPDFLGFYYSENIYTDEVYLDYTIKFVKQ